MQWKQKRKKRINGLLNINFVYGMRFEQGEDWEIIWERSDHDKFRICNNCDIINLMNKIHTLLLLITIIVPTLPIEIPMHFGPRCMILQAQFQPIKLQINTPKIPDSDSNSKFKVVLMDLITEQIEFEQYIEQDSLFRKNIELVTRRIYNLCVHVTGSKNRFNEITEQFYISYLADEDFDTLIGNIEIPQELVGQDNLKMIYNSTEAISRIGKKIISHQGKERELEDALAESNLHKNERIISLTLIECLVIVLSGVYQVFALRKFLIQKNLY